MDRAEEGLLVAQWRLDGLTWQAIADRLDMSYRTARRRWEKTLYWSEEKELEQQRRRVQRRIELQNAELEWALGFEEEPRTQEIKDYLEAAQTWFSTDNLWRLQQARRRRYHQRKGART